MPGSIAGVGGLLPRRDAQRSTLTFSIVNRKSKIINAAGAAVQRRDCGSVIHRLWGRGLWKRSKKPGFCVFAEEFAEPVTSITSPLVFCVPRSSSNEAEDVAAVYCVIIGISAQQLGKCTIFDEAGKAHPASQINGYLADAPNIFIDKRSESRSATCRRWASETNPSMVATTFSPRKKEQLF